jgi:hypothetical protein
MHYSHFAVLLLVVVSSPSRAEDFTGAEDRAGFQWKSALKQAGLFLSIEHAVRNATEPGTRTELKGPFVRDYLNSAKGIRGWDDGDPFLVNYIGHPFQGAVAGFIQVQNDPGYRRLQFGASRFYWASRLRATLFSAAYSTQFEIGPASEASLGNLGKEGVGGAGAVDLVVTPVGGLGMMLLEDALDRFVVRRIERATTNVVVRILVRGFLNPNRSFANMMRFERPWHRDTRLGVSIR